MYSEILICWAAMDMVDNDWTLRRVAKAYNISKSCLHIHFNTTLKFVNFFLYNEVQEQLKKNKKERHIRGGAATKEKYMKIREVKKMNIN